MGNKIIIGFKSERDIQIFNEAREFLLSSIEKESPFDTGSSEYKSLLMAVLDIGMEENAERFHRSPDYRDKMTALIRAMVPYQIKNDDPEGRLMNKIFKICKE